MKIKKNKFNRNIEKAAVFIVIICVVIIYLSLAYIFKIVPFSPVNKMQEGAEYINKPSMEKSDTEERAIKEITEDPRKKLQNTQGDKPNQPTLQASKKGAVNVLITNVGVFNGKVSASGMITDVTEEGGECTYVFSNGIAKIIKSTTTFVNPTSTSCKTVSFSSSELNNSENWTLKLEYSSASHEGTSEERKFNK